MAKLRVGILFGGRSGEHEVSLASARTIMSVIDRARYKIVPIGITHDGRWLTDGDPMATLANGAASSAAKPAAGGDALVRREPTGRELVPGATGGRFPPLDVVFPVLHGPYGEDGTVQGLLELAGIPYVGCGVLASSLAMDKVASKEVFIARGLPVVRYRAVMRRRWETAPVAVLADLEEHLGYPMFVKPANLGSSIGVGRATARAELVEALNEAARYDRRLLVEVAVAQAREIEVSVLGNDEPIASVPGEVIPSNSFYDYAAKYLDGRSKLLIPAPLPAETVARVRDLAVQAFLALDAAGLSRVDFLLDGVSGVVYLNEVNTLPGFTAISMYPQLWAATGIPYPELIDRLIGLAQERRAERMRALSRFDGAMKPAA